MKRATFIRPQSTEDMCSFRPPPGVSTRLTPIVLDLRKLNRACSSRGILPSDNIDKKLRAYREVRARLEAGEPIFMPILYSHFYETAEQVCEYFAFEDGRHRVEALSDLGEEWVEVLVPEACHAAFAEAFGV